MGRFYNDSFYIIFHALRNFVSCEMKEVLYSLSILLRVLFLFFFTLAFEDVDWNTWISREDVGGEDLVNNMAKWYLNPAILIYSEAINIYDALWINSFFPELRWLILTWLINVPTGHQLSLQNCFYEAVT